MAQDQLILYMALAEGESEVLVGSLTLHTKTAIAVAQELTGTKFNVVPYCRAQEVEIPNVLFNENLDEAAPSNENEDDPYGAGNNNTTENVPYGESERAVGPYLVQCIGYGKADSDK